MTVNGDPVELAEDSTVEGLLASLGLGGKWVVVERNRQPVARADLASTVLAEGDRIELVRAVAGG